MKTSAEGLNLIKGFEGFRSCAYQDSVGVWTIGYGHTRGVNEGMCIDRAQAENFLREDVKSVEDALNRENFNLRQNQFDALVSLFFNVGTGHLKNFKSDLANNPDSILIPNRMTKYVYAAGKILPGLVKRRNIEAELYKKKA
jgi:GH24 family phage-related lysozyme (muramidase)